MGPAAPSSTAVDNISLRGPVQKCNGATASGKPGYGLTVVLGAAAVEAAMVLLGISAPLAAVLSIPLAGLTFELLNFCGQDPPADPGMTQQDINDLTDYSNPVAFDAALNKFRAWFQSWYWCQVCNCDNGVIPHCGQPSNPGSLTSSSGLPAGSNAACYTGLAVANLPQSSGNQQHDLTQGALPVGSGPTMNALVSFNPWTAPQTLYPIPPGVTACTFNYQTLQFLGSPVPPAPAEVDFFWGCSTDTTFDLYSLLQARNNPPASIRLYPGVDPTIWPTKATHWALWSAAGATPAGSLAQSMQVQTTVECSGNPLAPGCCPPDPTIDQRLSAILTLLTNLSIKTPTGTTGYKRGNVHDNLSGTGTLTVTGLFGVLVEILTGIPTTPQLPGVPPYQWDVGWLSVLTPDGFIDEKRITRQAQVWSSALIPYANTVGYQISPGFTVRLTELLPA